MCRVVVWWVFKKVWFACLSKGDVCVLFGFYACFARTLGTVGRWVGWRRDHLIAAMWHHWNKTHLQL